MTDCENEKRGPMPARTKWLISVILALTTVAVYLPSLNYSFINYDDPQQIYQNANITAGITWNGVKWSFGTNHWAWHPLTFISHMVDCQIFGVVRPDDASPYSLAGPAGHHLVNVLFHAANAVLLLWVLYRMTGAFWAAALAAALFALHPLRVESVAWMTERKDVLFMFFGLWTIWFYVGYARKPGILHYLGVFVFMGLGLLCKSMLVTLPCVLLLLDIWPLGRLGRLGRLGMAQDLKENSNADQAENGDPSIEGEPPPGNWSWSRFGMLVAEKIPLMVLSAIASSQAIIAGQKLQGIASTNALSIQNRIANAFVSYARYIELMFFPRDLGILYPHPGQWPLWIVGLCVAVLIAITAVAIWQIKRMPYLLIGWLWYLGTSVPIIGLVQAGDQSHADRFTYLPMIGLSIMLVWSARDWAMHHRWRKQAVVSVAGLAIIAMLIGTSMQLPHWKNSMAIWSRTVQVTGPNYLTDLNMGGAAAELDLPDEQKHELALKYFNAALKTRPLDLNARYLKAHVLREQDKTAEAAALFEAVLIDFPEDQRVLNDLGVLYRQDKSPKKQARSAELFERAVKAKPKYAEALYNLAQVRAKQGQSQQAIELLQRALAQNPGHAASYREMGMVYYREGRHGLARPKFQMAIKVNPHDTESFLNLAATMYALGENGNAETQLNRCIELVNEALADDKAEDRIRKVGSDAHYLRAFMLKKQSKFPEALKHIQRSVQLTPENIRAQLLAARLLHGLGQHDQAAAHYQKRIALDPPLAYVHNEYGLLLAKMGRLDEAVKQFQRALEIDPDHQAAKSNLQKAQTQLQQLEQPAAKQPPAKPIPAK
jgi:tetratricopeptide (TPR) repeat protein